MIHDPDDDSLLPYDADAFDPKAPQKPRPAVLSDAFAYDGRGMHLDQFEAYVKTYDFGKVAPDHVIFHHTAIPDTLAAPIGSDPSTKWDRNEAGLSDDQIRIKRKRQLDALRNYYISLGWNAGFHLAIDDRFIWLFTPMDTVGIHAKWGNSFRAHGKLHYSIGIEAIGYYEHRVWPAPVASLVGGAVRALAARLGIALEYMYPVHKPGMKVVKGVQICANPARLKFGGLASHRDYNKPQCPGAAITEAFYVNVCRGSASTPTPPPVTPPPTTRYRVKPIRISTRREGGLPYAGELQSGEIVEIDKTYADTHTAHLASGAGFVDLEDLEAIV